MAKRGNCGSPFPKSFAESGSINTADMTYYSHVDIQTAGIRIDLPAAALLYRGTEKYELLFHNNSSGLAFLFAPDGFANDNEIATLAPYSTAKLGIQCTGFAADTYQYYIEGAMPDVVGTWTSTLTWTTGTPASASQTNKYVYKDGTLYFTMRIYSADGNAATNLTATLPAGYVPKNIGCDMPIRATWKVGSAAPVNALGYVDAGNSTEASRLIRFRNPQTCTDSAAVLIEIKGFVEIDGWSAWTVTETWTTGTPASITEVARYKRLRTKGGEVCIGVYSALSADSNATTQLLVPLPIIPPDRDVYMPVNSIWLAGSGGATYSNPIGYIDCANATEASRALTFRSPTTGTDGQNVGAWASFVYEIQGWQSWDPDPTWGTADPATVTEKAYFTADDALAFFGVTLSSADGNGSDSLVIVPPVPGRTGCVSQPMACYQLQNTTYTDAIAFADVTETDPDDRTVQFSSWSTATDTQAVAAAVGGFMIL